MFAKRLKQMRLAHGYSLEDLSAAMGGFVTKQALSKYENGKSTPSPAVTTKIATVLGIKAMHLFAPADLQVRFIAYRKRSGLPKKDQERIRNHVAVALEERVRLQDIACPPNHLSLPVRKFPVDSMDDAEEAAGRLRATWDLGVDPIACVTDVLEGRRIHVLEIEAHERFDGIACAATDETDRIQAAAVVIRRGVPGERQRLNIAHELGHLVMKASKNTDEEKAAFRFAGAFLAPAKEVYREVGAHRVFLRPEELFLLKARFGMSIQALLFRFRDLGIIGKTHYRNWCMDINRLGWRKQEPCPIPPERPQWLRRITLRAYSEGFLSLDETEKTLGERIDAKLPAASVERKAFMKLPLEERRRILAAQAEKIARDYEDSPEIQGGDIVEY